MEARRTPGTNKKNVGQVFENLGRTESRESEG